MNKIALVTGANRGIGFAVAEGLLKEGITVIVTSRKEKDGKVAVERLSTFGDVIYHQLDVTDVSSIKSVFDFIKTKYGKLDILINNAGINYDTWQNVQNADLDEVRKTLETNTIGPWQTIQILLPILKKSQAARIVNVSSGSGSLSSQTGNTPGYSLSKLGLNGITLQFANSLRSQGILVNSVCPGWVRTDMGGSGATRSPEKGAETIIWASLLDSNGPTGKFLRDKRIIEW
ncbi:SDR family oxidoreductase [Flagellimonas meridianipacifica]|uniref:NAD(P)-dependent dehydrogenase (Short-subunit alcohol dehydrogenase family) n=1 Tax=Flagellimonas meridianipacifica TaxID=1080225 RepID=A0A2T0M9M2_9FLAO|nr:SDR family oxidoreductase [Allomuricauda pacifica]PRX54173.1 NAD(P)-dependent dehydrogenase (short-subunit alcohol dehydrogenase family) [Allomuricauda pacifica]